MLSLKTSPKLFVVLAFGGVLAGMVLYGCNSGQEPAPAQAAAPAAAPSPPAQFALLGPAPKKSGVQLWSENCTRCHNARPAEGVQRRAMGHPRSPYASAARICRARKLAKSSSF